VKLNLPCLLSALVALTGCQSILAPGGAPAEPERNAAIAAANWQRVTDINIELRDSGFTPSELRLKLGQPYRLTVRNIASNPHYLNAPEFLRSVAARRVEVKNQVEVIAPVFTSFEVMPWGGQFQIEFVPLTRGTYRAHCHLQGDQHKGVEGHIVVE